MIESGSVILDVGDQAREYYQVQSKTFAPNPFDSSKNALMVQFKKSQTDKNDHYIQKKKNQDRFYYTAHQTTDLIDKETFSTCFEKAYLYTALVERFAYS